MYSDENRIPASHFWRQSRVEPFPEALALVKLNRVIQAAMGWNNPHLHDFTIENATAGGDHRSPDEGDLLNHAHVQWLALSVQNACRDLRCPCEIVVLLPDVRDGIEQADADDLRLGLPPLKPIVKPGSR
ncbi:MULTISPECIES: IS1096 element passenger TnpR family protein [unclassified Variovorax]|uniref:IS1096 element passenger TnpR family protein n=1 Tax=unclassified Variovorax TaxID=663243 RepID=UPI003F478F52